MVLSRPNNCCCIFSVIVWRIAWGELSSDWSDEITYLCSNRILSMSIRWAGDRDCPPLTSLNMPEDNSHMWCINSWTLHRGKIELFYCCYGTAQNLTDDLIEAICDIYMSDVQGHLNLTGEITNNFIYVTYLHELSMWHCNYVQGCFEQT